jgi:hypothetical protein
MYKISVAKGKGASGSNREAESTDAPERGGLPRSSSHRLCRPTANETLLSHCRVVGIELRRRGIELRVERRGWVIAFEIGSTGNGRNPIFNGRRQPSCGGTSRMTRECQVRICEGLGVKFPGPTRQCTEPPSPSASSTSSPSSAAVRNDRNSSADIASSFANSPASPLSRRSTRMPDKTPISLVAATAADNCPASIALA